LNDDSWPSETFGPYQGSAPQAINNHGEIAGTYLDANNLYHGFSFSGGVYRTIDGPSNSAFQGVHAVSINEHGEIVGTCYEDVFRQHGFIWSPPCRRDETSGDEDPANAEKSERMGKCEDAPGLHEDILRDSNDPTEMNVGGGGRVDTR
jgi:hypothetical protein